MISPFRVSVRFVIFVDRGIGVAVKISRALALVFLVSQQKTFYANISLILNNLGRLLLSHAVIIEILISQVLKLLASLLNLIIILELIRMIC